MAPAALGWLSSVFFPPFLLFQMVPSGKVSVLVVSVRTRVMLCLWPGEGAWLALRCFFPAPLPAKPGGRPSLCPLRGKSCLLVPSEATQCSFLQPKPAGQGSGGDGLVPCRNSCYPPSCGSLEQNFCVPTETAPTEHFCPEICILQAAGEALELFWEKGFFPGTQGNLQGVTVGQALISSPRRCVQIKSQQRRAKG